MSFQITVKKIEKLDETPVRFDYVEIFSQTLDELNLPKFVTLLNKQPRQRKAKGPKVAQ